MRRRAFLTVDAEPDRPPYRDGWSVMGLFREQVARFGRMDALLPEACQERGS